MNIAGEVIRNAQTRTPPPAHMKPKSDRYKPGQTFNVERFAEICAEYDLDPAEAAVKLLQTENVALKDKEKLDAYIKLMEYGYAKKRSVEAEMKGEMTVKIEVVKDFGDTDSA